MQRTPLAVTTASLGAAIGAVLAAAFAAAIALAWAGAALAAPSHADQAFAAMAAQAGQAELQAGQLAQQSASMPRLRQYGQTLVNNYGQYNDQLQQLAQQQNLTLPDQPTVYQHAESQRLLGLNGDAFDHAFLTEQVRQQGAYLARFQQEANSGHDPDLRKFAHDSLPMLRLQLLTAQSLLNQVPSPGTTWRGQD